MVGRVVRKRKAPVRRVIRRRPVVGGRRVVRRRAPVRRMGMGRRRVMGRGNWWDTIKSGFNTAKDFVKDNRLLSRGLRMIPGKYSAPLANLASTAGYGMRRRRTSGRGNWWDTIKSGFNTAKDFVKDNRLLSRGLRMIPGKYSAPLANLASTAGYGMRRRRVGGRMMLSPPFMGGRKRRVGGRVVFPSVWTTGMGGLSATTG